MYIYVDTYVYMYICTCTYIPSGRRGNCNNTYYRGTCNLSRKLLLSKQYLRRRHQPPNKLFFRCIYTVKEFMSAGKQTNRKFVLSWGLDFLQTCFLQNVEVTGKTKSNRAGPASDTAVPARGTVLPEENAAKNATLPGIFCQEYILVGKHSPRIKSC
jgi:hypothetical protein